MVIGGFIKNSKSKNKQPEESLRIATKHPQGCRCKIKKMKEVKKNDKDFIRRKNGERFLQRKRF